MMRVPSRPRQAASPRAAPSRAALAAALLAVAGLAGARPAASTPEAVERPPAASWEAAARAWEETARRLEALGERERADEALAAAAEAWERAGATAAARARVPPTSGAGRVYELTEALRKVEEALDRWRRAAVSWAEAAERWEAAGNRPSAADARRRAGVSLAAVESLEARRDEVRRLLEGERRRVPGLAVTPEGRAAVLERWAATARSWEETARTWDDAGDTRRAAAARARAEEARARILDLDPTITRAWLLARTVPRPEAPTPPAEASPEASPETAPEEVVLAEVLPETALRRPVPPPAWRLSPKEREALEAAEALRRTAARWEETARLREAEGDRAGAATARAERDRSIGRAFLLEERVRRSYAEREAEIGAEVARLLGETAPTAEEILAGLDAAAEAETAPPIVAAFRPLAPPDLPPEALPETGPERERRGLIDIATGGPIPSTLTVSGRKVIEVAYTQTDFKEEIPDRPGGNTQSSVDINQELQVRVFGRVGAPDRDHIDVEVNFDDTRRGIQEVNNRTIRVEFDGARHAIGGGAVGPGRPNQYELNAQFGDVSFTLPGSRYAVYNKSLFGLRGDLSIYDLDWGFLEADRLTFTAVASQTKGVSASKVFRTSGARVPLDIDDIDFLKRTFYRLNLDPALNPVRDVVLFRDDRVGPENEPGTVRKAAVGYEGGGAFSHTGNFVVLTNGQDYIVNLQTGVVEIKSPLGPNEVLAATFTDATGFTVPSDAPKILQIGGDGTAAARTFFRRYELRNRYSLGREQIRRDDPDFVFEVRDLLGNTFDQASGRTYANLFGFDEDNDNDFDEEELDYDFGVLTPKRSDTGGEDTAPFVTRVAGANPALSNHALYNKDEPDENDRRYTIHVEFVSATPQDVFVIGQDVIAGSDLVYVDGRQVQRNRDYVIEYEGGFINFINPGILGPNSEIRVDYEFLPFGGRFERTIAGGRVEAEIAPYLTVGTTGIFDLSADADEAPRLAFGGAPDDNFVFDVDARMNVMDLLRAAYKRRTGETPTGGWWDGLSLSASGEWARSSRDPNTFGLAVLEDFEAVDDVVAASTGERAWTFASAPTATTNLTALPAAGRGRVSLSNVDDFGHLDEGLLEDDETQRSLRIEVDFAAGETWVALVQPLSRQPLDFSRLASFEAFFTGAETLGLFVDFGLVAEDDDADGVLDSEDLGLDGAPGTGDPGENDGLLNTGEDVGYVFNHPNAGPIRIGAGNGFLDSEDLDGDFLLDFREDLFRIGNLNASAGVERQNLLGQGGATWTAYKVSNPLAGNPAVAATADADSRVVKQIRLVFTRPTAAAAERFTVFTDGIQFRRSRFTGADSGTGLSLLGRNDREDSLYVSLPEFHSDKGTGGQEQALAIQYTLDAGETATVEERFPKRVTLADYSRLRYYLYGDGRGALFKLRLFTDDANFVEVREQVTFGRFPLVRDSNNWRSFEIDLLAVRDLIISNILGRGDSEVVDGNLRIVGLPLLGQSPSLANINGIEIEIENPTGAVLTGEVWLNEITARGVRRQEGDAATVAFSGAWRDLVTLSGDLSSVDAGFRGVGIINNPVSSTFNQKSSDDRGLAATIQLHRLLPESWRLSLPLTASWRDSKSTLDPFDVESALKSDLGTITNSSQSYGMTVRWMNLPAVNLSFSEAQTERDLRDEDRTSTNDQFNLSTGWSYAFPRRLFGVVPTGQALSVGANYSFTRTRSEEQNLAVAFLDRFSNDKTENASFHLSSTPIAPISLRYNLGLTTIDRETHDPRDRRDGTANRTQSLSANWNIRERFGLAPSVSTNASYAENFFLTVAGATQKDVATRGDFNVGLQIDPSKWSRYLSWLTIRYGYQITAAASYRGLPPSTGFSAVFGDFMEKRLFPWGQGAAIDVDPVGVVAFRGSASTNTSHNWDGTIRTWAPLTWRYNASLTRSENFALSSFSLTEGFSGRMDWRLSLEQAFPNLQWWESSTLLWGLAFNRSEAVSSKSDALAPNLSWSIRWHPRLLTTLGVSYNRGRTAAFSGAPRFTRNESWSPTLSFDYAFDIGVPSGISLPGEGRVLELERRVRLNGSLGASFARAEDQGVLTADNRNYNLSLSLAYRIQRNLELTAGANASVFEDDFASLNDRTTLGANSRLVWQF